MLYSPALNPPRYVPRSPYGSLIRRGLTIVRNPGGVADHVNDDDYVDYNLPQRLPFRNPHYWARIRARTNRFGDGSERGRLIARYRARGRGSGRGSGNRKGKGRGRRGSF